MFSSTWYAYILVSCSAPLCGLECEIAALCRLRRRELLRRRRGFTCCPWVGQSRAEKGRPTYKRPGQSVASSRRSVNVSWDSARKTARNKLTAMETQLHRRVSLGFLLSMSPFECRSGGEKNNSNC